MTIVSTSQTIAFTKTEYPPVFDGSQTIRPKPRKVSVKTVEHEIQNLEFSPPAAGSQTLRDLLEAGGHCADQDTMHVNTFERLMQSTHHNLLVLEEPAVQARPQKSLRCRSFLSVEHASLVRADFQRSLQADEALLSLQGLFDFWNKFVIKIENRLTVDLLRRKSKLSYQSC